MQHIRASLIAASLFLAFGAAADPSPAAPARRRAEPAPSGLFADYLDGRFALEEADPDTAADAFLRALAVDPGNADLQQQAFIAALFAGRSEALVLARQLSDNPVAQLLLANRDVKSGNWEGAEQRYRALPRQGATQLLQPLLLGWAEQGAGKTDAALNTLRPYVEGQRFRGVYALHAAMIADLAGRSAEAGRLYQLAATQYGGPNIRLAQIIASWQARQGHNAEALETLKSLGEGAQQVTIALPALAANLNNRPVGRPAGGIAEAYLALAAALNAQEATSFSLPLLRLALDLQPDFTAARLLLSEIYQSAHHDGPAEHVLAAVPQNDTLYPVVVLRRAALEAEDGQIDEAMARLEQVSRAYPDSPLPLAQQGDLLRSKNRFDEAVTAYDRAIARLPAEPPASDWPLFYARGIAEERAHHWPRAEVDFQHALKLAPDQPYVLNYLGYTWADQDAHLNEARQMLEKAAAQRPNDGSIVDSLGWVLLRQGQTADAVRSLEQAVELTPEDATINGHLGDAYWAAGRKLEATYQWRRALTLNPDPDDAAKLEAKLREDANPALAASPDPERRYQ
ncbi:MAG: tetratricopeptide repeat protein [Acetobacteraceae bacterium]|nr:tetratricopeptide repeat protein [Acetobacteraceae bacterium]